MTSLDWSRRSVLATGLLSGLLPAAGRAEQESTVGNAQELALALAAARPGDEIVLADGDYPGSFALTRSGTAERPIVIRAANLLGARFTAGQLQIDASWIVLHGTDHVGGGAIRIGENATAAHVEIRRCRFRDRTANAATAIRTFAAERTRIAYCEMVNWQGTGILLGAGRGTRDPEVTHCLFRDTPAGYEEVGSEAIRTLGARGIDLGLLVERCKFKAWNGDANKETLKLSSSSCIIRQCVQDNCVGYLANRGGQNNTFDACWSRDSWGIIVHDGYLPERVNKVLGCKVENARDGILVAGGTVEPGVQERGTHNLAEGCVVAGCDGHLIVGFNYSTHDKKVRFTRIREHVGTIELRDQEATDDGRDQRETRYSWSPLIWLRDDAVGPLADLPSDRT